MDGETGQPGVAAIEARGISRSFGGVHAVENASFAVRAGEVHALVGENGAGKSTLIRILGGLIRPDGGEIRVGGETVSFAAPREAHIRGIRTVFQELTLFPAMSVAENLLLGREPRGPSGLIRRSALDGAAEAALAGLGITHIDPRALVEEISLAERQVIEIARAVLRAPGVLFLDEPTSALVEHEVEWLFAIVRRLRGEGRAVVFTSHRWREVASIADRITIMRNGAEVGTFPIIEESEAVRLMTGRRVGALYPPLAPAPAGQTVLAAEHIEGPGFRDVSFDLRAGEILGFGGLTGHGHRELFLALFGAVQRSGGALRVAGKPLFPRRPRDAMAAGIALIPEDRKTEGLLLPMSVRDNLTLALIDLLCRAGVIERKRERSLAQKMVATLQIKTPSLAQAVGNLSGGNQQKVLLGRWLLAEPQVLMLSDVTRGVDVATKSEIYELIMRLAAGGRGILLYSSDALELSHLCHRVLVMREGRIVRELAAGSFTAEDVVAAAVGETQLAA
ncbi:MAG: sugar ABC transporter ATP-binding protein [Acetobacteraceae bacterium]